MIELLWHSAAPWDTSGYGQQTQLVTRQLHRQGVRVGYSVPGGRQLEFDGYPCWDGGRLAGDDLARNVELAFEGRAGRAVAFIDHARLSSGPLGDNDVLYWYPFNFDPPPPHAIAYLRSEQLKVAALSRWGANALQREGIEATHLPCAVNTASLRPVAAADRVAMRQDVGIPEDAFVVGMVAVNNEWETNRKSFPEALMAFARFRERRDDAILFLFTDASGSSQGGFHLESIVSSLDIPDGCVVAPALDQIEAGVRPEDMHLVYGMFDVLLAPSAGEGFGLPVIEAQACGIPVIVTDFTSLPELVGSGWTVGGQRRWSHYGASWLLTPDVAELVELLDQARSERRYPCSKAIHHAQGYDVEIVVARHWMPLLDQWIVR